MRGGSVAKTLRARMGGRAVGMAVGVAVVVSLSGPAFTRQALGQVPVFPQNEDKAYFLRDPNGGNGMANRAYWHVGLATTVPTVSVWDDVFTTWTAPLAAAGGQCHYVFSQCFGGGMAEEVTKPGGRISASSASRWDETANYAALPRNPPPQQGVNNSGRDWAQSYINASKLVNGNPVPTAATATSAAWGRDPWGTYPANPQAPFPTLPRGPDERANAETAQYRDGQASGLTFNLQPNGVGRRFAVLWSGAPMTTDPNTNAARFDDRDQILDMYSTLVTQYNYNPANIFVMYGNATDQVVANAVTGSPYLAADANLLQQVLTTDIAQTQNFGIDDKFFFFSNDHGTIWNEKMSADRSGFLRVPKGPHAENWLPGYDGNPINLNPDQPWRQNRWWVPAPGAGAVLAGFIAIGLRRRR